MTRKEIQKLFPGKKIKINKVSFEGFGYGEAYTLKVCLNSGRWIDMGSIIDIDGVDSDFHSIALGFKKLLEIKATYKGKSLLFGQGA